MNISFVCQSGILEAQAALLAISLRKNVPNEKLIACVPNQFGDIDTFTKSIFSKLDVEVVFIKNEFDPVYPCGNKLSAAVSGFSNNLSLFLDSDMVCFRPFSLNNPTVITTGRYDVITHLEWKNVFAMFDLPMPVRFEHVRSPFVSADLDFAKRWRDNALKLWKAVHSNKISLRKIRQVDQISLTITVLQSGGFDVLSWHDNPFLQSPSEVYNFDNQGVLKQCEWPVFLVLQKGWLYYERQGSPTYNSSNPNSLAYYPEIRSFIYDCLSDYPELDRIPSWDGLYKFYFSQFPVNNEDWVRYMRGVEGGQK